MKKIALRMILTIPSAGLCVALLLFAYNGIKRDIGYRSEHPGFDVILGDSDICAFSFVGEILYAGGADGLFAIDTQTLAVREVGDYAYVRALLRDSSGLLVGHDAGLTRIGADGATENFTTSNLLPDNRVNALLLDGKNRLWVGTWGGAVMIDGNNVTLFNTKNGLLDNMVNVIAEDGQGDIWFGSYVAPRGGVSVLTYAGWQYFTREDDLLHSNITSIICAPDGSMIAGGGLYTRGGGTGFVCRGERWVRDRFYTKENGLAGEKIRSLYYDSKGRLWVGSEYDGLTVFRDGNSEVFDETSGLSCNEVKIIIEDDHGNIWIGTRRGITRILKGVLNHE